MMSSGMPQLLVYLAAVQQATCADKKTNTSVFGIITDAEEFKFLFLDSSMKLFISKGYEWAYDAKEILQWIDRILTDAINSSPYTTPSQSQNTTLFAYETAPLQHHQFSVPSSSNEIVVVDNTNIPPVNIFLRSDREYREVDRVRYMGRDLIIVEHESDSEDSVE